MLKFVLNPTTLTKSSLLVLVYKYSKNLLKVLLVFSWTSLIWCLYLIEFNITISAFIKCFVFSVSIGLVLALKFVYLAIRTSVFLFFKTLNVLTVDILAEMYLSVLEDVEDREDLYTVLTGKEPIWKEVCELVENLELFLRNISICFEDFPCEFSGLKGLNELFATWCFIIFVTTSFWLDYWLTGIIELNGILIWRHAESIVNNEYTLLISPLIFETNEGLLELFRVCLIDYSGRISILFLTLLALQVIMIIYYQINKQLNYKSVINVINCILFLQIKISCILYILEFKGIFMSSSWINSNLDPFQIVSIRMDELSLIFVGTVYCIGFFVNSYQFMYLHDNPNKERFFVSINIFIISMIIIILSANWLLLLLAWEVLGQSSFFLISFFKNKPSSFKSGYKAFFFNKISDITLLLAFVFYLKIFQSFDFFNISYLNKNVEYIGILILITAFVKSAQFFFYFWLPDSMEAPVPASALIHSATLVSAGIYLSLRFIVYIENSSWCNICLMISAPITMIVASAIALNQTDIKRLLAYSTISNCAFIYFILLTKDYNLAQLYFVVHGIVKSLSFLIAGFIIHQQNHNQDFRNWELKNKNETLATLILLLTLLVLATTPVSLTYNIKNPIYNFNTSSDLASIYFSITLVIYSINSYMYGLKILMFILLRKFNTIKVKRKRVYNFEVALSTIKIISIYYLYIILVLLVIFYFYKTSVSLFINYQWLVTFVILTVALLYWFINLNKHVFLVVLMGIVLTILLLI